MSNLQSFIPIINGAITDIQQAQGLDSAGRKALAGSVITKLVAASSLSADEQALINMVAPLLINDLDTIKNLINLAATRGAFRAEELSMVGTVYDKLTAFLSAVIEQAKAQEAGNADASTPQGE